MRPVGLFNNNPPPQRNQSATNAGSAGDAGSPGYDQNGNLINASSPRDSHNNSDIHTFTGGGDVGWDG